MDCNYDIYSQAIHLTVGPPWIVVWPGDTAYFCLDSNPYNLSGGFPLTGHYFGAGVVGHYFNPFNAGAGWHTISFGYVDLNTGCGDTINRQFYVDPCVGISEPGVHFFNIRIDQHHLNFEQQGYFSSDYTVEVRDVLGQTIQYKMFDVGCQMGDIDLSGCKSAIYFVSITDGRKNLLKKIVLQ